MEEIIRTLSTRLGVSETSAREAVKAILRFARDQMNPEDFQKLAGSIPGAAELLADLGAPESGGSLGGIAALFGGPAAQVLSQLQAAGISTAQVVPFVQSFLDQARTAGAGDVVDALLAKTPALRAFVK